MALRMDPKVFYTCLLGADAPHKKKIEVPFAAFFPMRAPVAGRVLTKKCRLQYRTPPAPAPSKHH